MSVATWIELFNVCAIVQQNCSGQNSGHNSNRTGSRISAPVVPQRYGGKCLSLRVIRNAMATEGVKLSHVAVSNALKHELV